MRLLLISDQIHDGSGGAPFRGALLVDGGRIAALFRGVAPAEVAVEQRIDVGQHVLCPGFVDLHTHSDVSALSEPGCVSAIQQGITTQVVGHCGFSAAPVTPQTAATMVDDEPVFGFPGVGWNWTDVPGYLAALRERRPATNVLTLVGHGTVRRLVMGGASRRARPPEAAAIATHVSAALEAGAAGVSTGLSYAPGMFADETELHGLARIAGRLGRRYHTHMRYGGTPIRTALAEAIAVASATGVAVNISHLYPAPDDPPGEAERILADVDRARAAGLDVTFDLTVFCRGGGAWLQALPGWARAGGLAGTVEHIADPAQRAVLVRYLASRNTDWNDQLIVKVAHPENGHLVGSTIGALARAAGEHPAETALRLVAEDGQFWVAPHVKRQADLDVLIRHPACVPVSDGMAAHPVVHRALGAMPKTFGTVPMVLGSYVRERQVLPLPDAIHKLTQLPAERAGIVGRGLLAPGYVADLVVFDPDAVLNNASDERPARAPAGIDHVMVNGRWAVCNGQLTGQRAGEALTAA